MALDTRTADIVETTGYTYILSVMCLLGIFLNCLILVTFTQPSFLSHPTGTYRYLACLAAVDGLVLLVSWPISLSRCDEWHCTFLQDDTTDLVFTRYDAHVYYPVASTASFLSSALFSLTSLHRYLYLRSARALTPTSTNTRTKYVLVLVTILVTLACVPLHFAAQAVGDATGYTRGLTPFGNSSPFRVYDRVLSVMFDVVPWVVMLVCNILLILSFRRESGAERRRKSSSDSHRDLLRAVMRYKQRQVTRLLIVTTTFFLCLHLPSLFTCQYDTLQEVFGAADDAANPVTDPDFRISIVVGNLLVFTRHAFTFALYWLFDSTFRASLGRGVRAGCGRAVACCCCCCLWMARVAPLDTTETWLHHHSHQQPPNMPNTPNTTTNTQQQ